MAGFSQADLARELGLAPTTISAIINGRSHSAQVEQRIAEITGHTLAELWPQWHGDAKPLVLSETERALVLAFRDLSARQRADELARMQGLAAGEAPARSGGNTVIATGGSAAAGGNQTIGAPPRRRR